MGKIITKKIRKKSLLMFLSIFFSFLSIFTFSISTQVYADSLEDIENNLENSETESNTNNNLLDQLEQNLEDDYAESHDVEVGSVCTNQSGAIGWIICPTTGIIAKASDAIYSIIENILQINPTTIASDSTVHIVWQYIRDITNIIFIIFLLVVVISYLTGFGVSNYDLKKILPRLIIVAILVNLSFIICQIAIDISNILGASIRETFYSIEEKAIADNTTSVNISWSDIINAITGTGLIASAGITFTGGLNTLFWTLVPIIIGALVSVIIGLITIALRQGLIMILAMIAPLAFVCFLLPNTENWFSKWKSLFLRMIIFYPIFSFLFGASHIAGWAIITSSVNESGETSGFGVLVGMAVQMFPLFGSWSLMKMSGTILGTINDKLHNIAAKPISALNRSTMVNRDLAKSKYFGGVPKGLSQEVMQKINDRQIRKMDDIKKYNDRAMQRGIAYSNKSMLGKDGRWTKRAENFYELQANSMEDQKDIEKIKGDFNKGLGAIPGTYIINSAQHNRLRKLDLQNMNAADNLKYQIARTAKIDYDNTQGFQDRTTQAINAHFDDKNQNIAGYISHNTNSADLERYTKMLSITDGNIHDVQYLAADASYSYSSQLKSLQSKFDTYNTLTPATQDVEYHIKELARSNNSTENIDAIVSGMRILNDRGDTNLITSILDDSLANNKVQLGTHASQSLANFLMLEVKDKDPFLRRFGKYINLETAHSYNTNTNNEAIRHNHSITLDEYIRGEYVDGIDTEGNQIIKQSKKNMVKLLEGTSFKGIERTALDNITKRILQAYTYTDENDGAKKIDMDGFIKAQTQLDDSTFANLIGDQFSFLSGSEQIVSLGKYITGVKASKDSNGKPIKDTDGKAIYETDLDVFGDITLSEEQQNEFKDFHLKRTEKFLNGQVANQVARTKSDMLAPILGQFKAEAKRNAPGHEDEKGYYDRLAGDTFKDALNVDVFENLVSMYDKGYQGDTKSNLVEALRLNDPTQIRQIKNERKSRNKGQAPTYTVPKSTPEDKITTPIGLKLAKIYQEFAGNDTDTLGFWHRAKQVLISSKRFNKKEDFDASFGAIDHTTSSYTTVADLFVAIINKL